MTLDSGTAFLNWLDQIERKHGWTDYRFAKQAGISSSVLSRARSGIPPKWDACAALADAAGIARAEVFRAAGLMKPDPKLSPIKELLLEWADKLTDDDAAELAALAEMKARRREEKKRNALGTTKP